MEINSRDAAMYIKYHVLGRIQYCEEVKKINANTIKILMRFILKLDKNNYVICLE